MNIKTLRVAGIEEALHAMRHPKESYARADSVFTPEEEYIGPQDEDLTLRLEKAGPEHAKHLRMMMVWLEVTAPRYWYIEMDTYRIGVEKISTSTMHKLMSRPIELDDFENDEEDIALEYAVRVLNARMAEWHNETDKEKSKEIWRSIIQLLPQSYLQTRTMMMSYAAIRNIVKQRRGHKLKEWHQFIEWAHTLPEADTLIFGGFDGSD